MRAEDWTEAKEGLKGRLCIDVNTPVHMALLKMRRWGVHHLIVERDGIILGVVADRDIFERALMDNGIQLNPVLSVNDVFKRQIRVVDGDEDLREVARVMTTHRSDAVLVRTGADSYGILTAADMLVFLQRPAPSEVSDRDADRSVVATAREVMANPLAQNAMRILSDIGI